MFELKLEKITRRYYPLFNKYSERIYNFFVYLLVLLSSIYPYSDNDWGWHFKYGEYFFQHGKLLMTDIYSWTLPGYQWTNHSWLYDLILYQLSRHFSFIGLSIATGFVGLLTFYFIIQTFKLSYWKKAIAGVIFVLLTEEANHSGFRSQSISLMFFAILMNILIRSRKNIKWAYTLPPLFLLWANMHADFSLGLGIAGVFLGMSFLIKTFKTEIISRKLMGGYALPLIIAFAVTFINPFTYNVYLEGFRHISNPYLQNVLEWRPIFDDCAYCHPDTFVAFSVVVLAISLYFVSKKKYYIIPYIIVYLGFIYPTFNTRRFLPIFCVVLLPPLLEFLEKLKWDFSKLKIALPISILLIVVGLEVNFYNRYMGSHLYTYNEYDYCHYAVQCSPKLANYLVQNPPQGKGFNLYTWGGYFIGKGVPVKLFVDGRMHVWIQDGYQPFADFIKMYYDLNIDMFKKYDFDWVVVEDNQPIADKLYSTSEMGNWKLQFSDGNSDYFVRVRN